MRAGRRVLIVDDDPEFLGIAAEMLELGDYEAVPALDGKTALEKLREEDFDLVLLDVLMPGKDGWTVLRELKQDPTLRDIPVVMISIADGSELGFALGATDYLAKPIGRDQLNQLLREYAIFPGSGHVLIIDDDPEMRGLLRRGLGKAGFAVAEAAHGREGLKQVHERTPDLILLDLMMPVMDGLEFLVELRAEASTREIPVIVITAKDLSEEDRQTLNGRIEHVVQKGSNVSEDISMLVGKLIGSTTEPESGG